MRAIILGYGSAGKRHYHDLLAHGITDVAIYDPAFLPPERTGWGWALDVMRACDLVVVASPPGEHLHQIAAACAAGHAKVLCEKPLCGFGELARAREIAERYHERVMVSYNYRWHSGFWPQNKRAYKARQRAWVSQAQQYRDPARWPRWGFLLDHLAHNLDMLDWQAGALQVTNAQCVTHEWGVAWRVDGATLSGVPFHTEDWIANQKEIQRRVYFRSPEWHTFLRREMTMFGRMWDYVGEWLAGRVPPWPNLEQAVRVQGYLEDAHRLAGGLT